MAEASAYQVLVVDDDEEIRSLIRRYLDHEGYEVRLARDGREGLAFAREGADLVILDLMMPGLSGLEVTRRLREASAVPILILTARGDEADRVSGLEIGADDYVTKPFSPRELLARVKALIRRSKVLSQGHLAPLSPLVVDAERRLALYHGEPIDLTRREYDLLRHLVANPGRNFTREELLNRCWGEDYAGDSRRVDVHISNLRDKLGKLGLVPIRSIWGVGYRFEL